MRLLVALAALALALTLIALPAAADEEPHITDGCGDAMFTLRVDDETTGSPDPYSPSFDIRAAWFTTAFSGETVEGVDLSMHLCGDAVEPQWGQNYIWRWTSESGCELAVTVGRAINIGPTDVTSPLSVRFYERCRTGERALLLGNEVVYPFEVYLEPADALRLDGDTITVSLRAQDLDGPALDAIAEGAAWLEPVAITNMGTGPESRFFVHDADIELLLSGGADGAGPGRDYVVGD